MIHSKIFISDEGYGPIVRQSAIIEELEKLIPNLFFDVQTEGHFDALKNIIPQANSIKKFNNIKWDKTIEGSPDLEKIKERLLDYERGSGIFIKEESFFPYDFIISDFVYEAFEIYAKRNIPSFGVAHFTWDWFFSKLFPPVLPNLNLVNKWIYQANMATHLFFPPFTPAEILNCYKKKAIEVPLIVRKHSGFKFQVALNGRPNILIIDSGSKVNHKLMLQIFRHLPKVNSFNFYVQDSEFLEKSDNVFPINPESLLSDYIPSMDLVLGRAGFNTISECIASRVPMMLFSEYMNPEMNENILHMNGIGFGSFIKLEVLVANVNTVLNNYFDGEYQSIKNNLKQHDIKTNGAEVIANYIANEIS